jgi:paraquat-inducible protein B
MAIVYEAIAITGTYTDKNGEEKKRWVKCGVVMSTKSGGLALKLEALPTVFDGWISLVEPKEKEADAPPPAAKPAPKPIRFGDDDVPFAPRDNRGDFW